MLNDLTAPALPGMTPPLDGDPMMVDPMAELLEPDTTQYEQVVNLATALPGEFLIKVGERVCTNKSLDWGSGTEWRGMRDRWLKLFSGKVPGKSGYEKNLLFVHMPYLTKAVNLFHPRMHRHFFPSTGDFYTWDTPVPERKTQARKLTRHINFMLRKRVPEYVPAYDRGGVQTLLYGSAFSVWYHSPIERRPCFEFIGSDDLIVSYKCKSDRPDMADVPRITWVKRYHRHELEQMSDDDYYVGVEKIYTEPYGPDGAPTKGVGQESGSTSNGVSVQRTSDEIMGTKPAAEDDDAPRVILEQDCWLKLPGEKRARSVTICVDEMTRRVLRLVLREKDDPRDAQRYRREAQLRDAQIEAARAAYDQATAQYQAEQDAFGQANQQYQETMGIDQMTGEVMPPPEAPAAMMPEMEAEPPEPERIRRVPFHRFTHYGCLPNPEGFYHYGIGVLLEGPNIVANEAMSGYASLMRLNQRPTGMQSRNSRGLRGEHKIVLGEITETAQTPEQVNAGGGIKMIQFPPPDSNAFKLEERMAESCREITVDDVVGGAPGLSGQTAAETEMRNANAREGISTIAARIDRSRLNEQVVFAYIVSQTLDEKGDNFTYQAPPDPSQPEWEPAAPVEEFQVTREDYEGLEDFDIVATSDPAMASQPQRQDKALKMLDAIARVPPGTLDPVATVLLNRSVLHKFLAAMDEPGMAEMVRKAVVPPPPQQMAPEGAPQPGGESNGEPVSPPPDVAANGGDAEPQAMA